MTQDTEQQNVACNQISSYDRHVFYGCHGPNGQRVGLVTQRSWVQVSGSAGIVENIPLLRVCVCVHCCVCTLGWVKFRAQILSMGHHTWPHITSLHDVHMRRLLKRVQPEFIDTAVKTFGVSKIYLDFYN